MVIFICSLCAGPEGIAVRFLFQTLRTIYLLVYCVCKLCCLLAPSEPGAHPLGSSCKSWDERMCTRSFQGDAGFLVLLLEGVEGRG